ncbi:hypothetical protein VSS37_04095 [Candidatus Thiothrix sp. Deng01]|uniref:GTPase n=1 Tax=Candidatus Thiothrix phosphatis TaxID=3112415 RepID=A0ABU6CUU6_9GAMM|nr:hypothetical protein [Candidatus Thiothrix sp. Deng01]MEB4590153.1 hypothetical protein [Candidatus Thiothrix sp. Deng01]
MATAEAQISNHRFIPLSEGKARAWVAALPLADPGETTRRIFHGLVDLNRRALPAMTRLNISEMLRPAVEIALEALQRHLEARSFPLTQKSQKIFELTQSLMLEFAGSYQLAALDMLTKKEGNKKALQLGIYRAMDFMGRVLLLTYSVYVRTRETLWHDIHHLYLLATENGLDQLKIRDCAPGAPSIEARYVQMNLLALVKPYSLRQGEVARLTQYFVQNSYLVGIGPDSGGQQIGDYVHAIILNSDEPALMMLASDLPHSPTVRVLALKALVARMDEHIRDLEAKGVPAMILQEGLSRNLAKRVIYHLTAVRNRSFNRFPKNEKIGMVTRMVDVLTVIRDSQRVEASEDVGADDALFNVFMSGDYEDEGEAKQTVIQQVAEEEGARIQTWSVMNTSVGGYGLCWEGKEASGARVGEIVALKDLEDDNSIWMIGVIKWMEFVSGKGLCCGVELLSTKVMVLSVQQVTNRALPQKLPVDGLMLPSIEGARPDPALILPAYIFQAGDEIRLEFAEREERVRLVLLDECLGAFAYFRFTTLVDRSLEEDEDDFTSLWQSL